MFRMCKIKTQWTGCNSHRYESNPLEEKFALAWQKLNDRGNINSMKTIDYILSPSWIKSPTLCTLRDQQVSNSVIRWLGSPCGRSFIKGVLDENKI